MKSELDSQSRINLVKAIVMHSARIDEENAMKMAKHILHIGTLREETWDILIHKINEYWDQSKLERKIEDKYGETLGHFRHLAYLTWDDLTEGHPDTAYTRPSWTGRYPEKLSLEKKQERIKELEKDIEELRIELEAKREELIQLT